MNSIGEIIATNRKKKKLTQPQLAEKLAEHGIQVSYKTISGWENSPSSSPASAASWRCPTFTLRFLGTIPLT